MYIIIATKCPLPPPPPLPPGYSGSTTRLPQCARVRVDKEGVQKSPQCRRQDKVVGERLPVSDWEIRVQLGWQYELESCQSHLTFSALLDCVYMICVVYILAVYMYRYFILS